MNKIIAVAGYGLALVLIGCASGSKPEPGQEVDPKPIVTEAVELMKQAREQQSELLSYKEYSRAAENLKKAQQGLAGGYESAYTLDKATKARNSLQQALELTRARTPNAKRILQARRSALNTGLRSSERLVATLVDVDDDLRDETDNFAKPLEPKEFSEFQKKYFALEIKAVQFRELDAVKNSIRKAARAGADDLASGTLRKAQLDVSEADNLIAQSPRDPSVHKASVDDALASSVLLTDVMEVILDARGTPENVALRIVHQNRELAKLSENVGNLEQNLKSTETSLMQSKDALKTQDAELKSTRSNLLETESALMMQKEALEQTSIQVRFQKAMDEAVRQFSEDDAEVYQQGSKLIFRLKRINFASGASTLPAKSRPLLAKINDIIKSIDAETVDVLGHTDSVGPDDLNSKLSNDRAISVARYLSSLGGGYQLRYRGYGESRPIASNETVAGRAINRRVDLEVTARRVDG